jgi:hypothetical protein
VTDSRSIDKYARILCLGITGLFALVACTGFLHGLAGYQYFLYAALISLAVGMGTKPREILASVIRKSLVCWLTEPTSPAGKTRNRSS